MRGRDRAVKLIARQFHNIDNEEDDEMDGRKRGRYHYGVQELQDLLDFIYEGPPMHKDQALKVKSFGYSYKKTDERRIELNRRNSETS